MRRLLHLLVVLVLVFAGCQNDPHEPLGPPDSYRLFRPVAGRQNDSPPTVRAVDIGNPTMGPLVRVLEDGFGSEMVRTAYLAKQWVGDRTPVVFVVGTEKKPYGHGLAIERWLREPAQRSVTWVSLPADFNDKALSQTVAARLAEFSLNLVLTRGKFEEEVPAVLNAGYRMAMEVVAREWRIGTGPAGVIPSGAGTEAQRMLFAGVRENRYVMDDAGKALRPPAELLTSPGVAATVLYRLAQSKAIAQRPAPAAFYAPLTNDQVPPGFSPAAVLGAFRNFQAKLFGSWAHAIERGRVPRDVVDLIDAYTAEFPEEKPQVLHIFLATTFGATVEAGGLSPRPEEATRTMAALQAMVAEVVAGKRSLRAVR